MTIKRRKRKPGMKGISRIDQPEKHSHGWFVRVTRKGKRYSAFCSDKKNGGKSKALAKAKVIYVKMVKDHPPMSRKEFAQIARRPGKTGIVGVGKLVKFSGGRKYVFWQAIWSPKPGEVDKRAFSVGRYGETKAKKLAIQARKKGLSKMAD